MRRAAIVAAASTALAGGALLAGSGAAMAAGPAKSASAPASASVSADVSATADAATGGVQVNSVSAGATATVGGAASGSGYACIVQTRRGKSLVAYKPLTLFKEGRSYEYHWLLSPYSVKHARVVNGSYTFQVQLCITGRGHTWNKWHQWFDGGAMELQYRRPLLLGDKWGTAVVRGSASSTLSFQLNAGVVTIGGSTQVSSYGTHNGDEGHDPNLPLPKSWRKFDVNRVNAFYISPHNFIWDGTTDDEGNVGHALYEFPTAGTKDFAYGTGVSVSAICGSELNCPIPF
jgi:hypothetical protein